MTFDEVSNNVYKVTLTDSFGRQAETTDTDLENAVTTVEAFAFDIQKQISNGWNKFLYDTCIIKLGDKKIIEKQYHEKIFEMFKRLKFSNGRNNQTSSLASL